MKLPRSRNMLRNEAARWVARLQSGRDPRTEERFRKWVERSPAHAEAFDRISRSYSRAGLLRESALVDRRAPAAGERPRTPRYALAAAASVAVIVSGVAVLGSGRTLFASGDVLMLATRVGEIRQVTLGDGSTITLDTGTSVAVEIGRSRRKARLGRGRARFRIARAKAPFVIDAGDSSVTSSEGVLDVDRTTGRERVAVLAGHADLRASGGSAAISLHPGEAAKVGAGGAPVAVAMTADPAWPSGMLQFDGTPLSEAAARASLYSTHRIVIAPDVGQLRVTGAFHAGDTAGFARALAAAFHLALVRTPDGNFLLSGRSSAHAKITGG